MSDLFPESTNGVATRPIVKPPPFSVVQKGGNISLWVKILNRLYLRLFSYYRKLPRLVRLGPGKAIVGILTVLFGLITFLEWWSRDDKKETGLFYQSWNTTVGLFNASMAHLNRETRLFANWIDLKTNAIERHVNQVNTRINEIVLPRITGINVEIDNLRDRMENPQTGQVPILHGRVTQLRDYLLQPNGGLLPRMGTQLDTLWGEMFNPEHGIVPILQGGLQDLRQRLYNPTHGDIPKLETGFADLTNFRRKTEPWLTPVMEAVPAAALVPALPVLIENVPKLRAQCRWDSDDIEQMLSLVLLIPSLALVLQVAEDAGNSAGEIMEEITGLMS